MRVLGSTKKESEAAAAGTTPYALTKASPPLLAVFDNKGKGSSPEDVSTYRPRVAVLQHGVATPILEGDSPVLSAMDLESVSLIDISKGLYLATTSMGKVFVFILKLSGATFSLEHVAESQLPVPSDESSESHKDENRTNIEAVRCVPAGSANSGELFGEEEPVVLWGGRGGAGYAGSTDDSAAATTWLRAAPLDPATGAVDTERMKEMALVNLGPTPKWRALSAMDVFGDYLYFTGAYDGEEDGHELDLNDPQRQTDANKAAFGSLVARVHLESGEAELWLRLAGLKLEALTVVLKESSLEEEKVSCMIASDDEGLGSLVGRISFSTADGSLQAPIEMTDIGASSAVYQVPTKYWGCSGIALLHTAPSS